MSGPHAPPARLAERPRHGRPSAGHAIMDTRIREVIGGDPWQLGYHSTVWTAPLLGQCLRDVHHIQVSRRSVGLALARLDIAWKRPRYDLARRAPTWRQAKGGSNGVSQAARGR